MHQFFAQWFHQLFAEDREGKQTGWRNPQKGLYDNYVAAALGSRKLSRVKPSNVQRALNAMAQLGLSDSTRAHVYCLIQQDVPRR